MRERLYIFDTTLRDGQQTAGVDFLIEDKQMIVDALDALGVDYIEGGYPGANPTDSAFFRRKQETTHARMTAFGMTKRSGRSAENDPGFAEILNAEADAICLVAKSWDFHVDIALQISLDENLATIRESVAAVRERGRESLIDCEHFFDGYKANPTYALQCVAEARDAGARWIVLCDTNGGTIPDEVYEITRAVTQRFDGENIGIHAHNDTENAVANSLAALASGVRQIQGTLNGLGERCGNANLVSLIPTLLLKDSFAQYEIGISLEQLSELTRISHQLDDILNRIPNRYAPYVGANAFAHKGGIHVSAVMKNPASYEHVPPESIGNQRTILVSDQAGRSNIIDRLTNAQIIPADNDKSAIDRILHEVKARETIGYSYDGAVASFEILALKELNRLPHFFEVDGFDVHVSQQGTDEPNARATIRLIIDGEAIETQGNGNGPINALDIAFRADLRRYARYIDDMKLIDYKVRILNAGTRAITRVTVESQDAHGRSWRTCGVNANIVVASFEALHDAIVYKLWRDHADPAPNKGTSNHPANRLAKT